MRDWKESRIHFAVLQEVEKEAILNEATPTPARDVQPTTPFDNMDAELVLGIENSAANQNMDTDHQDDQEGGIRMPLFAAQPSEYPRIYY